jgi:cysteine-rich repeat protein
VPSWLRALRGRATVWATCATVALAALTAGCHEPRLAVCDDGGACAPGLVCGMAGETRICVTPSCGNGRLDRDEGCDDGNNLSGDGCPAACEPPCGDGILDPGELCDDRNAIDGDGCDSNCTATACGNGLVTSGEICDDGNAADGDGCDRDCSSSAFGQKAALGSADLDAFDEFGGSVALSADGSTLAVSAAGDDSAAAHVGGDPTDNAANGAGAVHVFIRAVTRTGAAWSHQAYIKAFNTDAGDGFGCSIALSSDGSTLAVGACHEAGSGTGVGGDRFDNTAPDAGAVYVFVRTGTIWRQEAYIKASNTDAGDAFGASIALSADGSALAVGAPGETSSATGVGGNEADNSTRGAGAVYVFVRGQAWMQEAYLKASNTQTPDAFEPGQGFGTSVALSGDGATLAVGAPGESSGATGVNGDPRNNFAPESGAAYVFLRRTTGWHQHAYIKASNTDADDSFGISLALSGDGATLAVGAWFESSAATDVGGHQDDDSQFGAGAAYVFTRGGAKWSQQAYVKASNTGNGDHFGKRLVISADGLVLAVGAEDEDSVATGIDGDQTDNSATSAGAVYLFVHTLAGWSRASYVKSSTTKSDAGLGCGVALSRDGSMVAVGARHDDRVTNAGGDSESGVAAGAVYVFH